MYQNPQRHSQPYTRMPTSNTHWHMQGTGCRLPAAAAPTKPQLIDCNAQRKMA